ncbi:LPXTG cell wall anchor domain-containing protein [Corynebacterium argentoratense]|uniref:LPXTG cell wall anchor domain-containing protein n=1 Tax=Corynebacterium argentoratense TaxID=42817 RepID=UPI00399D3E3D
MPKDPAPQPAEQPAPERKQLATTGSDLIPTLVLAGTLSVIGALLLGARRNRRS